MAEHLISKRLLEVISNPSAGNEKSLGKPPFSDFQGHFHGHEAPPGRLGVADASLGMERTANRSLSPVNPALSLGIARHPKQSDLGAVVREGVPETLRSPLHVLHRIFNRGSVRRRISGRSFLSRTSL
jgi:hypothetical protein